jgi:hypothetical protein
VRPEVDERAAPTIGRRVDLARREQASKFTTKTQRHEDMNLRALVSLWCNCLLADGPPRPGGFGSNGIET